MIPISTKDYVRFTPDRLKEELGEDAPIFLLKVPTLRDKINIDALIAEAGARFPPNAEYATALRRAVIDNVIYDDQPKLLQLIEEFEGAAEEAKPIDPELAEQIETVARTLRPFSPGLGAIDGARTRFIGNAMLVRAELFLMGIEGPDAPPLQRVAGRLTDACQDAIERRYGNNTLFMIGNRVVELQNVSEDERKNSPSPPASSPDPETSKEVPSLPTVRRGKSSANGTSIIHA